MICVSILKETYQEIKEEMINEEFVELRLDRASLSDFEIENLFSKSNKIKTIATCRSEIYSDIERKEILIKAIKSGADYIDIEIEADNFYQKELITFAKNNNCKVIISYHNYLGTPEQYILDKCIDDCEALNADIAKIACHINSSVDLNNLHTLYSKQSECLSILAIGMGDLGKVTRITANYLGAKITFVAKNEVSRTAPGQLTKVKLTRILKEIEDE